MRALIDGVDGGALELFKAEDATKTIIVANDDGSVKDCSLGTVQLLVYDTPDRRNTVTSTLSGVSGTAAIGTYSLALTPALLSFGPGRYWGFVRYINSGISGAATHEFAQNSFSMTIR